MRRWPPTSPRPASRSPRVWQRRPAERSTTPGRRATALPPETRWQAPVRRSPTRSTRPAPTAFPTPAVPSRVTPRGPTPAFEGTAHEFCLPPGAANDDADEHRDPLAGRDRRRHQSGYEHPVQAGARPREDRDEAGSCQGRQGRRDVRRRRSGRLVHLAVLVAGSDLVARQLDPCRVGRADRGGPLGHRRGGSCHARQEGDPRSEPAASQHAADPERGCPMGQNSEELTTTSMTTTGTTAGTPGTPTTPADIEETRANLTRDIDELTDKVTPSRVVERRKQAARSRLGSVKDKVMGSASGATGGVKDKVMGSASNARSGVSSAGGSVSDTASGAASTVSDTAHGALGTIESRTEGNPLAAGLIAFGAGMLISALIPASEKEAQAAQKAVETAKEHGQPVMDHAKSVGQEMGQNLKESAADAAQEVKATAQDSAQNVKQEGQSSAQTVKQDAKSNS